MNLRTLAIILTASSTLVISACCCGSGGDWETVSTGGDEADNNDYDLDDDDDDSASKDEEKSSKKKRRRNRRGGGKLAKLTQSDMVSGFEKEGWSVKAKSPNTTPGVAPITVTAIKGTKGGTAFFYKGNAITLDAVEKANKKNGSAVKRKGDYMLVVAIPKHNADAEKLLDAMTK